MAQQAWVAAATKDGYSAENEVIGSNMMFLAALPFCLATGVQAASIHAALIVGTALAGSIIVLGALAYMASMRRTPVYLLDAAILIAMAVQLGVSYAKEDDIDRTFVFILNASLTAFSALTLVFGYPFTIQYIREALPREHWRHPNVIRAAVATTTLFCATFIANTLLYLIPVAQDVWYDNKNGLTVVFRYLLPCIFFVTSLAVTRYVPTGIAQHLTESAGFNSIQVIRGSTNPLAHV